MFLRCAVAAIAVQMVAAGSPAVRGDSFVQTSITRPSKTQAVDEGERAPIPNPSTAALAEIVAATHAEHGREVVAAILYDGAGSARTQGKFHYVLDGLGIWAVWMVLAFIVVHTCYTRGHVPKEEMPPTGWPEEDLESGHFGCFNDSSICCCSFFCPGIRWADTLSQAQLLEFWPSFCVWCLVCLLNAAVSGVFAVGIFTILTCLYFRQEFRKKLKKPAWRYPTVCVDFFFICFCSCCAIAQEAMVARKAAQAGIEGFGRLEPRQEQPMPV